ncbi:MAG: DUF1127 domain-containing protein [Cocleimonas sp.]|nr:DUF1127 domain-containing protein [Cocleimonas sp.]
MSGVYVEAKLGQHFDVCEDVVLNKKITDSSSKENLFSRVDVWIQRSRQRKQLAQLSQHLLNDIGLTEEMVAKEIAKPFWK